MFLKSLPVCRKCRWRFVLVCTVVTSTILVLLLVYFFPGFPFRRKLALQPGSASRAPSPPLAPPACVPKRDLFFLKTHKCASSTVQNVLLRYGHDRNLNFVLPTLGNYLGNQAPFSRQMAALAPWHRLGYNVFCHHTVFDEVEVAAIMPADTVYLSIVREPATLFESLYSYARLDLHYGVDLAAFSLRSHDERLFLDRSDGYLGVNQMAYDFGLRPAEMGDAELVGRWLERLDRRFDLVLVAERFDESMVLLKERLCWSLEDVAYFRHNARRAERKGSLAAEAKRRLERLNAVDARLYRHFRRRFGRQVRRFGLWRMRREVAQLRRINARLREYCLGGDEPGTPSTVHPGNSTFRGLFAAFSDQVENLVLRRSRLSNSTCHYMAKSEIAFTNQLKMGQMMKAVRQLGVDSVRAGPVGAALGLMAPTWLGRLSEEMGFVSLNVTGFSNPSTSAVPTSKPVPTS